MLEEFKLSHEPLVEPCSFIDAVSLLARPYKPPEFLVRHLVPKRSIVLLSGDSGSAKTALALHMSMAIATDQTVASRFNVELPGARVLYVNAELGSDHMTRFLKEAAAGLEAVLTPGRLYFEGSDGFAEFSMRGGHEAQLRFESLVDTLRPDFVVFDTMRAILTEDESSQVEVRQVFTWIRETLVNKYGASVLVAHHIRKISNVSNSDRERVSGSRDLIGVVDTHLAARAQSGQPMNALHLGKTRTPADGVASGTTWPIEARLEPGAPARSIFIASNPDSADVAASAEDSAMEEIVARLDAEGSLTIEELNVRAGARKRAWSRLQKLGAVVQNGKRARKTLYALASKDESTLFEAETNDE